VLSNCGSKNKSSIVNYLDSSATKDQMTPDIESSEEDLTAQEEMANTDTPDIKNDEIADDASAWDVFDILYDLEIQTDEYVQTQDNTYEYETAETDIAESYEEDFYWEIYDPLLVICHACKQNTDCGYGGICHEGKLSIKFCTVSCIVNPCPQDYSCIEVNSKKICLTADEICPCEQSLAGAGYDCYKQNCKGTSVCEESDGEYKWSECSAKDPAGETCNGLDDDCNDLTDDLGMTGYCGTGGCYHNEPVCVSGLPNECHPDKGNLGWDVPDWSEDLFKVDTNCDGIDGDKSNAVFVDLYKGSDDNNGTSDKPVSSLQYGIELAGISGKKNVYVSYGVYKEKILIKDGISVYGGFSSAAGWVRSANYGTFIEAASPVIFAENITTETKLNGFFISALPDSAGGSSAVAISVRNAVSLFEISDCTINSAGGKQGISGSIGANGDKGSDGSQGNPACVHGGVGCDKCSQPLPGIGGASPCGRYGGKGGLPGLEDNYGADGQEGCCSAMGGLAGAPKKDGGDGWKGSSGYGGNSGESGDGSGDASEEGWKGHSGSNGTEGEHGNGGGGGGGAGGYSGWSCSQYGGAGGGGGGGGCGGKGGGGGQAGGASIGIYLYNSSPVIKNSVIKSANGGNGGNGNSGGTGGDGGIGGAGGGGTDKTGHGGKGGDGGKGGSGGYGGGGSGGVSASVICGKDSSPKFTSVTFSIGKGGKGGQGLNKVAADGLAAEKLLCK
jgi:hypothetical protein